jgi:ATP dependent DNA ligase-like protein
MQNASAALMLCARLENPARLADRRYIAEPKLDGQRAQVHIRDGRTVACYGRPGRDLLRHPGMAWLRTVAWPVEAVVLDGEACAGDGHEGIQAVFEERNRTGGAMSFLAFDLLELNGQEVMREPWSDRRKRLEDLFAIRKLERVGLVPVTEDAPALYETDRLGRRGHRPEGAKLHLPPRHPLAGLAEGEAEADPGCHRHGWITHADPLGRLGAGRRARVAIRAPFEGTSMTIRQAVRVPRAGWRAI